MKSLCRVPLSFRNSAGFTLLEALVTMSIVAIMLGLAAPSFVAFQRNSELTSTANAFIGALATARSEALKRQLTVFVLPTTADDWAGGLTIFADVDRNGNLAIEAADALVAKTDPIPASIVTGGYVGAKYVAFNGAGFMTTAAGSIALAGSIEFSVKGTSDKRLVITSPAGRMRVCKPTDAGCDISSL